MSQSDAFDSAYQFVIRWFSERIPPVYAYHSLEHTTRVYNESVRLVESEDLDMSSKIGITTACLFHDTGFAFGTENHEANSCKVFDLFLEQEPRFAVMRDLVHEFILATEHTRDPQTPESQLMKDADLHYLGMDYFEAESDNLRKEWQSVINRSYSDLEWLELNIEFMQGHTFYSSSAQIFYGPGKKQNLDNLLSRLSLLKNES